MPHDSKHRLVAGQEKHRQGQLLTPGIRGAPTVVQNIQETTQGRGAAGSQAEALLGQVQKMSAKCVVMLLEILGCQKTLKEGIDQIEAV